MENWTFSEFSKIVFFAGEKLIIDIFGVIFLFSLILNEIDN